MCNVIILCSTFLMYMVTVYTIGLVFLSLLLYFENRYVGLRYYSFVGSIFILYYVIYMWYIYQSSGSLFYIFDVLKFGAVYVYMGIDILSLSFISLTAFLTLFCIFLVCEKNTTIARFFGLFLLCCAIFIFFYNFGYLLDIKLAFAKELPYVDVHYLGFLNYRETNFSYLNTTKLYVREYSSYRFQVRHDSDESYSDLYIYNPASYNDFLHNHNVVMKDIGYFGRFLVNDIVGIQYVHGSVPLEEEVKRLIDRNEFIEAYIISKYITYAAIFLYFLVTSPSRV